MIEPFPATLSLSGAGLVPCIECGFMVGRSARRCVHCNTTNPIGVLCHLCEEPMKKSESVERAGLFFHKSCLTKHFTIPASVRCPDCGRSLAALSPLWKIPHFCPHCGADTPLTQHGQRPIYRCNCCDLPIFTAYQEYDTGPGDDAHYCTRDSLHKHQFCLEEPVRSRPRWTQFFQKCLSAWAWIL